MELDEVARKICFKGHSRDCPIISLQKNGKDPDILKVVEAQTQLLVSENYLFPKSERGLRRIKPTPPH